MHRAHTSEHEGTSDQTQFPCRGTTGATNQEESRRSTKAQDLEGDEHRAEGWEKASAREALPQPTGNLSPLLPVVEIQHEQADQHLL